MRSTAYPTAGSEPGFPAAVLTAPPRPVPVLPPADCPSLVELLARLRWLTAQRLAEATAQQMSEEIAALEAASAWLIRLADALGWSDAVYTELATFPKVRSGQ